MRCLHVPLRAARVLLVATLCVAAHSWAETYHTEAEHLLLLSGAGSAYANDYSNASGKQSVYLQNSALSWEVETEPGSYRLWVRARAGRRGDRTMAWAPKVLYEATVAGESMPLDALPDTLEFFADGENFMWGRTEPVELSGGIVRVTLGCPWQWAHVDALVLTEDEDFDPTVPLPAAASKPVPSKWTAWSASPYERSDPRATSPDGPPIEVLAEVPRGGTAVMAVNFHADRESRISPHLMLSLSDLVGPVGARIPAAEACKLLRVAHFRIQRGQVAADPLVSLDELGGLTVPRGETVQLWVLVDTEDAPAGEYKGTLTARAQFAYGDGSRRIPVRVVVHDVQIADRSGLAVFNWWGYHDAGDAWWQTQLEGGTNVFKAIVTHHVGSRFDSEGNLLGEPDFSRLDTTIDTVREADGQLLLEWYLHAPRFAKLKSYADPDGPEFAPFTPEWERAFRALCIAIRDHLMERGLGYESFAWYTYDENIGPDFIRAGKILRDLDPRIRIFSDRSATLAEYQAAGPYVDIWCPHFNSLPGEAGDGRLEFMRSTGGDVWAYDEGYAQRVRNPYVSYRLKPWIAWKYKLNGCTYWKFSGDDVGIVYYSQRGGGPVTSRRWEAWKKGLEDYRVLVALRDAGVPVETLDAAVAEVLADTSDLSRADAVLARLMAERR